MKQKAALLSLPALAATALVTVASCVTAGAQEARPPAPDLKGAAVVGRLPSVEVRVSSTVVPTAPSAVARVERVKALRPNVIQVIWRALVNLVDPVAI